MMKINYQLEMERAIAAVRKQGIRPRLLLHACCAPCSSAVLERLTADFDITVFYYNPNISPEEEYEKRAEELAHLIGALPHSNSITLLRGAYEPQRFYDMAKGHEQDREGGERCTRCFELRLSETAKAARDGGFDYFTTTLSISPLKDAQRLNAIGAAQSAVFGVPYLFSDFKKKDGYKRSCILSAEYGLYRQDYCGCVYSKLQREQEKG